MSDDTFQTPNASPSDYAWSAVWVLPGFGVGLGLVLTSFTNTGARLLSTSVLLILMPVTLSWAANARAAHHRANPIPGPKELRSTSPNQRKLAFLDLLKGLQEMILPAFGIALLLSALMGIPIWWESDTTRGALLISAGILVAIWLLIVFVNVSFLLKGHTSKIRRAHPIDQAILRERRAVRKDSDLVGALHVSVPISSGDLSVTAEHGALELQVTTPQADFTFEEHEAVEEHVVRARNT